MTSPQNPKLGLSEAMLKGKLVDQLLYRKPLNVTFDVGNELRANECENVVWLINLLVEGLVTPTGEGPNEELNPTQIEARRRFFKQGSLEWMAGVIKKLYARQILAGTNAMADTYEGALFVKLTNAQKTSLSEQIERLCEHPVWTAPFGENKEMKAVEKTLLEYAEVRQSFTGVALTEEFAVMGRAASDTFIRVWKPKEKNPDDLE